MRLRPIAGAATLAALVPVLSACATAALESKTANSSGGVEAYKLFSDTCDRHYAWPFSVMIDCTARYKLEALAAQAKAQADQVAAAVRDGVKEGVAEALKALNADPSK